MTHKKKTFKPQKTTHITKKVYIYSTKTNLFQFLKFLIPKRNQKQVIFSNNQICDNSCKLPVCIFR